MRLHGVDGRRAEDCTPYHKRHVDRKLTGGAVTWLELNSWGCSISVEIGLRSCNPAPADWISAIRQTGCLRYALRYGRAEDCTPTTRMRQEWLRPDLQMEFDPGAVRQGCVTL